MGTPTPLGSGPASSPSPSSGGGGGGTTNLAKLVMQLEKIEIRNDRDLYQYARLTRAIGLELSMRMMMDADWVSALLGQYKGKWYTFGAQSKIRAKLVGAHLRAGASAARVVGLSGVKMYASFQKHFVKPEIEAQNKKVKPKNEGFIIGDKPYRSAGPEGRSAA
ncbi:hypothetical protein OHA98_42380 [Streptomyces sp. NBC_00654]|uniref:hypothetical protein n=1 Tax=Streptomyces sp. NBC_00654 TaxID=2975799 RepID=UPI002256882D|nr:hypothetical protein [Streptomyces sp. NBC_00654]MCX4971249.1 hypothetical protein [Streptomyces sp. NBC_00654]